MSEQLKVAYTNHLWVKIIAFLALVVCSALLFWLSGGFPPWAWRFLFDVLPRIPHLWQGQGPAILVPLIGLVLLSTALLIMWMAIGISAIRIMLHIRQTFQAHQQFQMDAQVAERWADEVTVSDQERQMNEIFALSTRPVAVPQQGFASAPLSEPRYPEQSYYASNNIVRSNRERYVANGRINLDRRESVQPALRAALPSSYPAPSPQKNERRVRIPSMPPSAPVPGSQRTRSLERELRILPPPEDERLYGDNDTLSGVGTLDAESKREEEQQIPQQLQIEIESKEEERKTPRRLQVASEGEEEERRTTRRLQMKLESVYPVPEIAPIVYEGQDIYVYNDGATDQQPSVELLQQPLPAGSPLRLVVGVGLDPGIVRGNVPNEDSLFAVQGTRVMQSGSESVGLFMVADGMGGHANGREASRMAIQSVGDLIVPVLMRTIDADDEDAGADFSELLRDGAHRANLALHRRNRQQENMMGTTLTAALIADSTAYVINVGDSRTYLYRKSEGLSPITRDHSVVARMVENGMITPDDIYTHPKRNQIYRCLGERASIEVDDFVVPLRTHDILLLCSDGLWEMVRDEDMEKIIASSATHPSQIASMLVQAALSRGGADNVSVVVVYVAMA